MDPDTQIIPTDALPPAIPFTVQLIGAVAVPLVAEASVRRSFTANVDEAGVMVSAPLCEPRIAIVATTCFAGLALGVTVTVTASGCGAVGGAVKLATLAVALTVFCAVTMLKTPQATELHPTPDRDQDTVSLGLEFAGRLKVTDNAVALDVCSVCGALIVREKSAAIVKLALACCEGSATLVAPMFTAGELGRIGGAV